MKSNTTLRIAMICVICAATLMSGCMESDDTKSAVLFDVDLILNSHVGTGVMEVDLNEDGSATIVRITGTADDVIETGKWEIYRTTSDGTLYDITTDDTELRIKMEDGGHAIANIYENGFKKCGESFFGTWEQMMEEITDDEPINDDPTSIISNPKGSKSDDLDAIPMTVMLAGMTSHEVDVKRYILLEDESMELCSVGEYHFGSWKLICQTPTTRTYSVNTKHEYTSEIYRTHLVISDDGKAELELSSTKSYYGTWAQGIDRSRGACDPASSIRYVDPIDHNPECLVIPPVDVTLDFASMGTIQIALDDDGSVELCTIIGGRTQCETGEWLWLSDRSRRSRTYDLMGCCTEDFAVTLYNDGRAVGEQLGDQYEGTWEKQ